MVVEAESQARADMKAAAIEERVVSFMNRYDTSVTIAEYAVASYVDYCEADGEAQRLASGIRLDRYVMQSQGDDRSESIAEDEERLMLLKTEAHRYFTMAAQFGSIAAAARIVEEDRASRTDKE